MSLAHMLLSGIFIAGGADAFLHPGPRVNKVGDAGIPEPEQAVVLNGAVMLVAGTALALDIAPKAAAIGACLLERDGRQGTEDATDPDFEESGFDWWPANGAFREEVSIKEEEL